MEFLAFWFFSNRTVCVYIRLSLQYTIGWKPSFLLMILPSIINASLNYGEHTVPWIALVNNGTMGVNPHRKSGVYYWRWTESIPRSLQQFLYPSTSTALSWLCRVTEIRFSWMGDRLNVLNFFFAIIHVTGISWHHNTSFVVGGASTTLILLWLGWGLPFPWAKQEQTEESNCKHNWSMKCVYLNGQLSHCSTID